jgi:hypothetical protein
MKPSEFLMGSKWENKSKHDVFLVRVEYNKMNNFDKRFIDREELKTKILNKIKENDNNSKYGFSCITKEEILELLK